MPQVFYVRPAKCFPENITAYKISVILQKGSGLDLLRAGSLVLWEFF